MNRAHDQIIALAKAWGWSHRFDRDNNLEVLADPVPSYHRAFFWSSAPFDTERGSFDNFARNARAWLVTSGELATRESPRW